MADNKLYYGDNLDVLRRHVATESVDLVYLDPPFNSNADYNVLFAQKDGAAAAAQIQAFEDTWRWDMAAARALDEMVHEGGRIGEVLLALQRILGESDMMAYLAMMAPRLQQLHRVLNHTGSLYLHCDPTASHYLKVLLDAVFGAPNFRNEIIWERTRAHNMKGKGFARVNDTILYYSKTDEYLFNPVYMEYGEAQLGRYKADEDGRLYKAENLTFSTVNPGRQFEWRGSQPPPHRSWGASLEQLEAWYAEGRILLKRDGTPRLDGLKVYLDDMPGKAATTNWHDIPRIGNTSAERLGYPTQKPEALLDRIIRASSNEGGVVLDPFCGCGTTIAAAHMLRRRWIGIDITHLAVNLMKHRLQNAFGPSVAGEYDVIGEPTTVEGAWELAQSDPYQFQFWALGLVGARPHEEKKGADKGIDGRLHFLDPETGTYRDIIISVKAGAPTVSYLRDLRGVVEREKAAIGVLITMEEPTRPMVKEAATASFYSSPFGQHPGLQLFTVQQLLDGARIDYPHQADVTLKRAPKSHRPDARQLDLSEEG